MNPDDLKYTASHEWLKVEDDLATVGITEHAQSELGDIVFMELPDVGATVQRGDMFGTIESIKSVSDIIAPVSGEIVEVNEELTETPERVNESPYAAGWMVIVKMDDPSEVEDLMSSEQYERFIEGH
ncbi:MAG: glycine cleavage system protein GcvH [Armatimonadetes bacterium]|nr:glycine cleavage system protein GcvH [Armatimonadota bacterium]